MDNVIYLNNAKGYMMKKIAKIVMSSAIAASTLTVLPASPIAPPTALAQSCSTIHMVNADGTGSSNINNNPTDDGIFSPTLESIRYARENTKDIPNLSIDYWNIPYDSAAGAVFSIGSPVQAPVPYGLSRIKGAQVGLDHIKEYHAQCPNSKIGVIGYSQGASVAGDIAALLANGAVEGFDKDDFFGAILIADPGRSGKSEKYSGPQNATTAYIPLPKNATYQRNGEYSTATDPETIGWTGQRSLGFKDFSGRVISICRDEDVACAVEPNSVLRSIADISDKNYAPGDHYRQGKSLGATAMSNPVAFIDIFGGFNNITQILKSEDIRSKLPEIKQRVSENNTLDTKEKAVINNAINEVNAILTYLHREDAYGPNTPDNAILAHIIKNGYPTVENAIPQDFKMITSTIVKSITNDAPKIDDDIYQKMDPVVKHVVADYHLSYFNNDDNKMYKVDNIKAIDWVSQALTIGAKNLANNTPIKIEADPQNNGEIELAEQDRKDDGLRSILDGTIDSAHTTMEGDDTPDSERDTNRTPSVPGEESSSIDSGVEQSSPIGDSSTDTSDSTIDDIVEESSIETEDDDSVGIRGEGEVKREEVNISKDKSKSSTNVSKDKSKSSTNISTPRGTSAYTPVNYQPANTVSSTGYGPQVDTGGHIKTGLIAGIINSIR